MIQSTILQKASESDMNYLLTFDAMMLDSDLMRKRDEAYAIQDFNLATKLERISFHAQQRLNRRFNNQFKDKIVH